MSDTRLKQRLACFWIKYVDAGSLYVGPEVWAPTLRSPYSLDSCKFNNYYVGLWTHVGV